MAKYKKGYMIPFFLILVTALVAIVGSVTYLTTAGVRNIGSRVEQQKALYIAEAGLNKAIWYLTTPPEEGGMGIDWRTAGVTEEFGEGSFTISVEDDPAGLKITAQSVYRNRERTLQILADEDFADVFTKYAMYGDADVVVSEASEITGDLMADGNVTVDQGATVADGVVAVTEGNEVTGGGQYTAGAAEQVPASPSVDTSYYDNLIAVAEAGGASVVQGNQSYSNLDLNGQTLLVNGDVVLSGNLTGLGEIIATGNIYIQDGAIIGENNKLIGKSGVFVNRYAQLKKNTVLFGKNQVNFAQNFKNTESVIVMTPQQLQVGDNVEINGMLYGGQVTIGANTTVQGNVVGGSYGSQHIVNTSSRLIKTDYERIVPPGFQKKIVFKRWLRR
jgi:predicted acyltransferase (DUF342 family)